MTTQTASIVLPKAASPSFGRILLDALRDALEMRRLVEEGRPVTAKTMEKVRAIALRK